MPAGRGSSTLVGDADASSSSSSGMGRDECSLSFACCERCAAKRVRDVSCAFYGQVEWLHRRVSAAPEGDTLGGPWSLRRKVKGVGTSLGIHLTGAWLLLPLVLLLLPPTLLLLLLLHRACRGRGGRHDGAPPGEWAQSYQLLRAGSLVEGDVASQWCQLPRPLRRLRGAAGPGTGGRVLCQRAESTEGATRTRRRAEGKGGAADGQHGPLPQQDRAGRRGVQPVATPHSASTASRHR
jgi:hypothetical protein